MAEIIEFPRRSDHDWRGIETELRESYKTMPDGPACIDESMPIIKNHFTTLFPAFSVQLNTPVVVGLTEAINSVFQDAAREAVSQVIAQLRKERATCLATLAAVEYKAAYYRRNPGAA